jgi:hypothetical protein
VTALIVVLEVTVKLETATPLIVTALAFVKFVPVMVTV